MGYLNTNTYLSTLDGFLAHWEAADAALAPPGLVMSGGYDRATMQSERDALATVMTGIVHAINVREGLAVSRDQQRVALRARVMQFRQMVLALLDESPYASVLPATPQLASGTGVWLRALDETSRLWSEIETSGAVVPLVVAGGYGRAAFDSDAASLRSVLTALLQADQDVHRAVALRDSAWSSLHDRLVTYRRAVAGMFPRGNAMQSSLPRLSAAYRRRAESGS